MSTTPSTTSSKDRWYANNRLGGLRRFATAITVFNILGHTWFGFEQSWAQPLAAIGAAYAMELLMEAIDCWTQKRRPRFLGGGPQRFIDFFLPAHITGLACAMLLYSNDRLLPIVLATVIGIGSKHLIRIAYPNGASRHIFNPSNLGITATLLLLPWVGISPPYHFTENLTGWGDWLVPAVIVCSGTFLNYRFTKRLPLIAAWLAGFVGQAWLRHVFLDASFTAALLPMTGVAFILYTFYMVTDPPTTPGTVRGQVLFGLAVASTYGMLMTAHIVFGLFFALTIVSSVRGTYLSSYALANSYWRRTSQATARSSESLRQEPAITAPTT